MRSHCESARPDRVAPAFIPPALGHQIGGTLAEQLHQLVEHGAPPPLGAVARPPELTRLSRQAFAMVVVGRRMAPEIEHGWVVIVDPARQPRRGGFVVLETTAAGMLLKRLRAVGRDTITVEMINPWCRMTYRREDVPQLLAVVWAGPRPAEAGALSRRGGDVELEGAA